MKAFGFYFGQSTLGGIEVPQTVHLVPPKPVPRAPTPHDNKPLPPIGRANLQDPRQPDPVDYQSNGRCQGDIDTVNNTIQNNGEYASTVYLARTDNLIQRSLGRQIMYANKTAWIHSHGGLGYPADYGFGPGDHKDEMTPQFYMRPGVRPLKQVPSTIGNSAYK